MAMANIISIFMIVETFVDGIIKYYQVEKEYYWNQQYWDK